MASLPQVLKWTIPCDDKDHLITHGGVMSATANLVVPLLGVKLAGTPTLEFWTFASPVSDLANQVTAPPVSTANDHIYRAFATGVDVPANYWYRMSSLNVSGLVYHLFERM